MQQTPVQWAGLNHLALITDDEGVSDLLIPHQMAPPNA